MADDGVRFIRKDGRIIPIHARAAGNASARTGARAAVGAAGKKLAKLHKSTRFAHGVAVGAGAAMIAHHGKIGSRHPQVKVNKKLDLLGLGLSVASGVAGAATFSHGARGLLAGFVASHAIDAAGIAANVASVTGKGHKIERAKQGAKQEARNFVIGNAVFAAGIVATKNNRATLVKGAKAGLKYAGKTLAIARKVLRVGAV